MCDRRLLLTIAAKAIARSTELGTFQSWNEYETKTYFRRLCRKVDFSHRNIVFGVNNFLISRRGEFHVGKRQQILAIFHKKTSSFIIRNHRKQITVSFMRIHCCATDDVFFFVLLRLSIECFVFVFVFAFFCNCDTTSAPIRCTE